ncbi:MAG: MFS transporter [Dehalococcoidia bacterium]
MDLGPNFVAPQVRRGVEPRIQPVSRFDGLWRNPDFVRLWAAQTVSVFGSLITRTAIPFTAILLLDASALEVAFLTMCSVLPGVLVGLHAGVWVDRLPRRPVMIAADIGRFALLLTVPVAHWLDELHMEHLYAVALSTGVLTMFFDVAYRTYLPSIVPRQELMDGNAKLTASESVAEFSAFSVAGWLVQIFSGPAALLVDAVTFVLSALSLNAIQRDEPHRAAPEVQPSVREEALEGLRTVWRDRILRGLTGATVCWSLGLGMFGAVYMLFVTRGLGFNPGVLGVIFGIGGISALAGALLAERSARRWGVGPSMVAGLAGMGVSMLFIPMAHGAGLAAASLLIAQQVFGDGMFTVYQVSDTTTRQSITPEHMLGRVNAFMRMLELGLTLTGLLLGGLIGEWLGLRTALTIGAVLTIGAGAALLLSPARGVMRLPAPTWPLDAAEPDVALPHVT